MAMTQLKRCKNKNHSCMYLAKQAAEMMEMPLANSARDIGKQALNFWTSFTGVYCQASLWYNEWMHITCL